MGTLDAGAPAITMSDMKTTTAAGNLVSGSVVCFFCGKRVGLNAHGRVAKHGHNKWTRRDCLTNQVSMWCQVYEAAFMAMAEWAKANG